MCSILILEGDVKKSIFHHVRNQIQHLRTSSLMNQNNWDQSHKALGRKLEKFEGFVLIILTSVKQIEKQGVRRK